jgi:uncharacterized membrane protein
MSYCKNCGLKLSDEARYCAGCGASTGAYDGYAAASSVCGYGGHNHEATAQNGSGIGENGWAALAYILFLIPLLAGPKTPFVRFHINQSLVRLIFVVVCQVALGIIRSVVYSAFYYSYDYYLYGAKYMLLGGISTAVSLFCAALFVLGIVQAIKGKMSPLPIIGGITIIK